MITGVLPAFNLITAAHKDIFGYRRPR